jgi:hypothetical protein
MHPRSLDGVLAKARAFQNSFGADDSFVEAVDDQIGKFGLDEEVRGPRARRGGLTMKNNMNRRAALGALVHAL